MASNRPPNNNSGNSYFEQLRDSLKNNLNSFFDTIIHGSLSDKIIATLCVLFIFFWPGIPLAIPFLNWKGLAYLFIPQEIIISFTQFLIVIVASLIFFLFFLRINYHTGLFTALTRSGLVNKKLLVILLSIILIIACILIAINNFTKTNSAEVYSKISQGESFLIHTEQVCGRIEREKIENTVSQEQKKFEYQYYLESLCPNDPEARIYLNNLIAQETKKVVEIAVPVPISRVNGVEDSQEILRGVALAQDEWNKLENLNLVVNVADDGYQDSKNELQSAKDIAQSFASNKQILGVVGHFSSGATEKVAEIYQSSNLVAISPTSTVVRDNSDKISQCIDKENRNKVCLNPYVFRTASNDAIHASKLIKATTGAKVGIVYEYDNLYSRSFKSTFESQIGKNHLIGVDKDPSKDYCNFSVPGYLKESQDCLKQIKQANTVLLIVSSANASKFLNPFIKSNYQLAPDDKLELWGSDSIYKEEFVKNADKYPRQDTQGMLVAVPWHRRDEICRDGETRLECKAAKLFRRAPDTERQSSQDYQPLSINWRTASAYDATLSLAYGLQLANSKCGSTMSRNKCMREKLKSILPTKEFSNLKIPGALGTIRFDENGDRIDIDGELGKVVKVRDGNFEVYNFVRTP